jgi:hypothetical protein
MSRQTFEAVQQLKLGRGNKIRDKMESDPYQIFSSIEYFIKSRFINETTKPPTKQN